MYKNIIYITGNNSYAIDREVIRWRKVFELKYGNINIDRVDLGDRASFSHVRDNLLSGGLFAEKRLFIFSGGLEKKVKGESKGFENILEQIAKDIPEDHFLLFHNVSIKEEGLIGVYDERSRKDTPGWLEKNAEVRRINTIWDIEYWAGLFPVLERKLVSDVIGEYYKGDLSRESHEKNPNIGHNIGHTLELKSLFREGHHTGIDDKMIWSEGGGSHFALSDTILDERYDAALALLTKMLERTKIYDILPILIGNLRNTLYAKYLLSQGKKPHELPNIITAHPFALKKAMNAQISWEKISYFYKNLVTIDRAYKSGKGLQDDELGRIFSIELALLGLKKPDFMYNNARLL